ncbi:fructosamine kinase family protein [Nitrosophilus alvini]|uniref:fructosamine kinase family protein n=1 Tax=Nitrosophilus alvini TaxID=2714855 RepID=UPI001909AFE9|nr:fructosamine kinase family protein [Nitrosophilus alvini]
MPKKELLEKILNTKIEKLDYLSSTQAGDIYVADDKFVIKTGKNGSGLLPLEAKMLQFLSENSLPVPKVYYFDEDILIMEYIKKSNTCDEKNQIRAAKSLALLHHVKRNIFGFEYDTAIGPLLQPNPKLKSWIEFYGRHRVLEFAERAYKKGFLSEKEIERIKKFCKSLRSFLIEPEFSSLLHGDLWQGNIIYSNSGPVFIDPAVYFGHYEVEIAFTTMFGTFDKIFYDVYSEILPLEKEFWSQRRDIYLLYPYLVHVNIYGRSYWEGVDRILKKFGF